MDKVWLDRPLGRLFCGGRGGGGEIARLTTGDL
jgi:hypothetical protein